MKYILRFLGFGGMIIGLGGMAEGDNMALALVILTAGAILLGIDSIREDVSIEKKNHIRDKYRSIGIIADRPSYLR